MYWEERWRQKLQEFNQCWGRDNSSVKKSMEVATRGRENGSGKLKSMCIKNDAADITINAAKKMKIDKCVSC